MHLTKKEIKLLQWVFQQNGDATTKQQYKGGRHWIASQVGISESDLDIAIGQLSNFDCIHCFGYIADDAQERISIKPAGIEAIRKVEHDRRSLALRILERVIFSIVVPILVAGTTAYYVAFLKVGR